MTRNEAAYTGEVGSMQFSHFLQIYGKLYSLKYDGACRSKGPVHGYEAIRLKQIYKNRFIERREHAKHPSGGSSTRQSYCDSPEEYPTTPASSRHARPDSLKAQEKRRPNDTRSALPAFTQNADSITEYPLHESHRNSDLPRCTPHTKRARKKLSAPHFR